MSLSSPFPYDVPVSPETTDRQTGRKTRSPYFSQELVDWFLEQQQRNNDSPEQLTAVALEAQAASIATTSLPLGDLTAGYYRVNYVARITRAATVSSSLTVTIGWTTGAQAVSIPGAAMTGNTTATVQTGVIFMKNDANAPITYSTAYVSNGATAMQYALDLLVEQLPG